jgi:hypothetical protein
VAGRRAQILTRGTVAEIVFWLVALAPVLAVLTLPIMVVDDGPLHVSSAAALDYQINGTFGDVLTWRAILPPNLTAELALIGLLHIASPVWALKVFVVAVLVGFALAARRLITATGVAAPWAVLLLPFAWHRSLAAGFLGFSAGAALALLAIAVVLRRPTRPPVVLLAALLAATWLTHLVPAAVATAVCFTVVVTELVARRQRGVEVRPGPALTRLVLATLPVLVASAAFVVFGPPGQVVPQTGSLLRRFVSVAAMLKASVSTVAAEDVIYGLVALVLYAAAAVILLGRLSEDRRFRTVDALLISAVLGSVVAVFAPEGLSGAGGGTRVALFPPLLLAAWIAAHLGAAHPGVAQWRWGRRGALILVAAMSAVSLGLVAVRLPAQHTFSKLTAEMLELQSCLPERSTILQISLYEPTSLAEHLNPLAHEVDLLAASRGGLDMGNEAGWVPYYLWRYRDDQNLDRALAAQPVAEGEDPPRVDSVPPRLDLARAVQQGIRLDAVLVVGRPIAEQMVLDDPGTQKVFADLEANYELAATSSRGAHELWLRNGIATACA